MDTTKKIRCSFELDEAEAKKLCDIRCEPKPSTAAAQVVRMVLRNIPIKDIRA